MTAAYYRRTVLIAVLRRPWLLPAAIGVAIRFGLRPEPEFIRFRESVLRDSPTVDEMIGYLRWCARFGWFGLRGLR